MTSSTRSAFKRSSQHISQTLKARTDARRSPAERVADRLTTLVGSMPFLALNVLWFVLWIVLNLGWFGTTPFDPFPFGLLTMIVSLEAIVLAIVVLISQNRAARIADLREEVDLQIDVITEQELTKLLHLVTLLLEKQGINLSGDQELQAMLSPTDTEKLEASLGDQVL